MAVTIKITTFWDVTQYSLVDRYRHFGRTFSLLFPCRGVFCAVKIEAVRSSKMSVAICQTTRRQISEDMY
jgi:hypothetical protein